ncbi:HD domain-containing protein [Rickenella mellea]|uniref:5'-deoxynucleotidase n=1 Tax=Rickenella mellea TaxID=50990 RepID=A0A4Y7Q7W4_9AGAM|nr:HD domain-containing protein [Rickenella mellea]
MSSVSPSLVNENARTPKRVFPPLYKSRGDASVDRLAFFHVLERLKTQKRTGWIDHNIPNPESISDHMYRMAILALCASDPDLDTNKCVLMCLVHDLAEAQVGDITPREGISKADKQKLETEAMDNFVHEMLHSSPAALRIHALWKEYEDGETKEARFVKGELLAEEKMIYFSSRVDLDRFEMATQAIEYESAHGAALQPFFDSSIPKIQHPEVKSWGNDLMNERRIATDRNDEHS